jgi:2-dehydrotetronate isomerase
VLNFAANLFFLYQEHEFLDRFAAAARDGFKGVEFLFPYEFAAQDIARRLEDNHLTPALFNCSPGDWANGERGLASLPGRQQDFRDGFLKGLEYAHVIRPKCLHVVAGKAVEGVSVAEQDEVFVSNLAWATEQLQQVNELKDLTLVIEPINTRDMPGFFLYRQDHAHRIVNAVGSARLKVQMDWYHCQIVEGDIAKKTEQYFDKIGHIQIAGVPDRHEPNTGEVNYPFLFDLLQRKGYTGWIGCEYRPRVAGAGGTTAGLGWLATSAGVVHPTNE